MEAWAPEPQRGSSWSSCGRGGTPGGAAEELVPAGAQALL